MRVNSFAALVFIVIGLVAFLLLPRGRESEKEVLGDRPAPDTAESETPEEIDDAAGVGKPTAGKQTRTDGTGKDR